MKILFFLKTNQNLKFQNLGGIETLNKNLYEYYKKKYNAQIKYKLSKEDKKKNWDIIISSNNFDIFNKVKSKRKIFWIHNKVNLDKILRKDNFLNYLKFNYEVVFVSNFLKRKVKIFPFIKKFVIHNFLSNIFKNLKITKNRKKIFVYSVHRVSDLRQIISVWKSSKYINFNKIKLLIFGKSIKSFSFNEINNLKKYNIIFFGNVNKNTLIKYYTKSLGMFCPGKDETFCLNAVEGLACGLPIISYDNTVLNEVINKNNHFIMKKKQDIEKIIRQIINLNNNKRKKLLLNCNLNSQQYLLNKIIYKWNNVIFNE